MFYDVNVMTRTSKMSGIPAKKEVVQVKCETGDQAAEMAHALRATNNPQVKITVNGVRPSEVQEERDNAPNPFAGIPAPVDFSEDAALAAALNFRRPSPIANNEVENVGVALTEGAVMPEPTEAPSEEVELRDDEWTVIATGKSYKTENGARTALRNHMRKVAKANK